MISFVKNKILSLSRLEWFLFFFIFFAYGFFFNEYPGWNEKTRMNLIYAIVDQGKLHIDSYWDKPGYDTMDVAYYKGHFYCDKSPILSFLGVPVYWFWREIADISGSYINPQNGRYPVIVLTVSLPSALLSILLFRFLGYIRKNPKEQLLLTMIYAFGTIVFPYSTLFFSHQPAAAFLFFGFYILFYWIHQYPHKTIPLYSLFFAGLWSGLGFTAEPPTGIILLGLTVYLFFQISSKKHIFWFLSGIGIPILSVMIYNLICFSNPLQSGYEYEVFNKFREGMSKGLMGITYPKIDAIWGITFSPYRGLFFYCPVLLLAVPGFYLFLKNKNFKKEGILALYIVLAFFYMNFSYYEWSGGWGIGPRHIEPMIPFLLIPVYFFIERSKSIVLIFGFLSIIFIFLPTLTEPQIPQEITFPLTEFTLPRVQYALREYTMPVVERGVLQRNIISILFGIHRVYAITLWLLCWIIGFCLLYRYAGRK